MTGPSAIAMVLPWAEAAHSPGQGLRDNRDERRRTPNLPPLLRSASNGGHAAVQVRTKLAQLGIGA